MGDVVRALIYNGRSGIEDEIFVEPGAKIFGQIGHGIPRIDALFVEPIHDLLGAEAFVPSRFKLVSQAFESFAKEARFLRCESHEVEIARFAQEWKLEVCS